MQNQLTSINAVLMAGGKPKGEAPTEIETAYRAMRQLKDRLNEATGAHVLARQQVQTALNQVTPGANATVRRMADKSRGALIYLDAALEAAAELDARLGAAAEAVRQAAIKDNQRRAAWGSMRAEADSATEDARKAAQEREEYMLRYHDKLVRAKRAALLGVVGGATVGVALVVAVVYATIRGYIVGGGY